MLRTNFLKLMSYNFLNSLQPLILMNAYVGSNSSMLLLSVWLTDGGLGSSQNPD